MRGLLNLTESSDSSCAQSLSFAPNKVRTAGQPHFSKEREILLYVAVKYYASSIPVYSSTSLLMIILK